MTHLTHFTFSKRRGDPPSRGKLLDDPDGSSLRCHNYFFNSNNTLLTISSTCASIVPDEFVTGAEDEPPVNKRRCAGSSVEPGAKAASGAVRIS